MNISTNRIASSSTRRSRYSRLCLETFEERTVPAVVNANVVAGTLVIMAVDAASAEGLILTPGVLPGSVNVAGVPGTTISFKGAAPVNALDIAGVKSLNINLKGSVDSVDVQGVHLAGNVTIKATATGPATDKTYSLTAGTIVGGSVNLTANDGDDVITVSQTRIGKGLTVNLGKANVNNQVTVNNGSYIGGSVLVNGGAGQDNVNMEASTVGGNVTANLATNFDSLKIKTASIGGSLTSTLAMGTAIPQQPELYLTATTIGGNVRVTSGDWDNLVKLNDVIVGGKSTFALGNGQNGFSVDGSHFDPSTTGSFLLGGLSVTGGKNNDTVSLGSDKPVLVGGATTLMLGVEPVGTGDSVSIDDTTFLDTVKIDFGAGKGADSLSIETGVGSPGVFTRFAEKLTVSMGQDDDTVTLGIPGVNTIVQFGIAPLIDGGTSVANNDTINRNNGLIKGVSITGLNNFFKNFETIV